MGGIVNARAQPKRSSNTRPPTCTKNKHQIYHKAGKRDNLVMSLCVGTRKKQENGEPIAPQSLLLIRRATPGSGDSAPGSTPRQWMAASTPQKVTRAYLVVLLYSSNASGWNLESTPFFKLTLRCFRMIWPRIEREAKTGKWKTTQCGAERTSTQQTEVRGWYSTKIQPHLIGGVMAGRNGDGAERCGAIYCGVVCTGLAVCLSNTMTSVTSKRNLPCAVWRKLETALFLFLFLFPFPTNVASREGLEMLLCLNGGCAHTRMLFVFKCRRQTQQTGVVSRVVEAHLTARTVPRRRQAKKPCQMRRPRALVREDGTLKTQ